MIFPLKPHIWFGISSCHVWWHRRVTNIVFQPRFWLLEGIVECGRQHGRRGSNISIIPVWRPSSSHWFTWRFTLHRHAYFSKYTWKQFPAQLPLFQISFMLRTPQMQLSIWIIILDSHQMCDLNKNILKYVWNHKDVDTWELYWGSPSPKNRGQPGSCLNLQHRQKDSLGPGYGWSINSNFGDFNDFNPLPYPHCVNLDGWQLQVDTLWGLICVWSMDTATRYRNRPNHMSLQFAIKHFQGRIHTAMEKSWFPKESALQMMFCFFPHLGHALKIIHRRKIEYTTVKYSTIKHRITNNRI